MEGPLSPSLALERSSGSPQLCSPRLVVLSAADEGSLWRSANLLTEHLKAGDITIDEKYIDDLSWTLNTRRTALTWRTFAVLRSFNDLAGLPSIVAKPKDAASSKYRLGFAFTGQGSQWYAMGRELLVYPVYKASLLRSQELLKALGGAWLLTEEFLRDTNNTRVNDPEFSQPLCTALQIALVDLYQSLGIVPSVVVGHSSGEIAAAYCAGLLSQASAIKVAYYRGLLSSRISKTTTPQYSMASIGSPQGAVTAHMLDLQKQQPLKFKSTSITISCINSPSSITVSGPRDQLDQLLVHIQKQNIFVKRLPVDLAYHSPQMHLIASDYLHCLQDLRTRDNTSKVAMMSSVTCAIVDSAAVCQGEYWVQNMTSQVRFSEAMSLCCCRSPKEQVVKKLDRSHREEIVTDAWIELGPHSALRGPIRDILKSLNRVSEITYDTALVRGSLASETFLGSVGRLYCQKARTDLGKLQYFASSQSSTPTVLPNLPQYSFNHSNVHWDETHSNRRMLFHEHATHDLLGTQVIDWNPVEPKWSFIIKVEDLPWIADHKINGSILYPAAGMLVAAIEAVKKMAGDAPLVGYEIRDVDFIAPLLLTTSPKGTAIQVGLRSSSETSVRSGYDYTFHLHSRKEDESWEEICRGSIRADFGRVISEVDDGKEAQELLSQLQHRHARGCNSCILQTEPERMYRILRDEVGIDYGNSFQVLDHIRHNEIGEAMAMVEVSKDQAVHSSSSFVIHPTTLDGLFQLLFVALTKGGRTTLQTMVPTRIGRMWVSSLIEKPPSPLHLDVHAKGTLMTLRHGQSDISALDSSDQTLKIRIEGLETTAVSGASTMLSQTKEPKKICFHMVWKPDLDTMKPDSIQRFCDSHRHDEIEPAQWFQDLELLTLSFSAQALRHSGGSDQPTLSRSPYLQRYSSWLQTKRDEYLDACPSVNRQERDCSLRDREHLEVLCRRVGINARGQLHIRVGEELGNILSGETAPLELLFAKQDLLADFYTEMIQSSQAFDLAVRYLDAVVHKHPDLAFIEIGAGTGATTNALLTAMHNLSEGQRFKSYTFTDISPSFLEKARDQFSQQQRFDFRVLDIEADPGTQGFSEGTYDVLVASLVFHATKNLDTTLKQARKLLKPGGKLLLMELTEPDSIRTGFVFGLLPGWWLGTESFRRESPCISSSRWNEVLLENGFSGNDLIFDDYQTNTCHMWSIIVSTAVATDPDTPKLASVNLVLDKTSEYQLRLAEELEKCRELSHSSIDRLSVEEAARFPNLNSQHQIMLVGSSSSMLCDITATAFFPLQKLITTSATIIWVDRGGGNAPEDPYCGIHQGLSRVCRNENPKTAFVTVALEPSRSSSSLANDAATIAKVFERTVLGRINRVFEPEYTVIDGLLHINRLLVARQPNEHIFQKTMRPIRPQSIEDCPPLKLNVKAPGLLDSLEFIEDSSQETALASDNIEIDIVAIGVNFKECLIALGRVKSERLGSEFAGVVRTVGATCSQFQPGDRVAACDLDCYRTRIRIKENQAVKIPDSMSYVEAASIPTAFTTAYYSLIDVARLQKNESVLIHAASGGTGQAAIQIAALTGAEIFATVGSLKKKELLKEHYNIDDDHIFYSRDTSFADGIKRVTRGRGVDVVLNSLSGDGLRASWECTAPFGRFVEIGRRDIDARGSLPMAPFIKNLSFFGVDVAGLVEERIAVGQRILQTVMAMFETQKLQVPFPLQTYQLQDVEKAFRFIQSGKSSGKIVLEVVKSEELPVVESTKSNFTLHENASYLIAGGLGGLGRCVARWLVNRGAKNLLLLSRSGPSDNEEAMKLLIELRDHGVRVETPICDIADIRALKHILQQQSSKMPPIKGCFQASMVLRDSMFATMSHNEWTESIAPKVQGSWNLHSALPSGLDFFILLSSVCGIFGNSGQSNYAAGNTFQDVLARFRVSRGEKATALDLGIILSEGFVAENQHIMDHLMRLSLLLPISLDELFALFDLYCNPERELKEPATYSQLVTGLKLPADQKAEGRDILVAMQQPMFRHMHQIASITTVNPKDEMERRVQEDLRAQFSQAASQEDAAVIASEALRNKMSRILGVKLEEIQLDNRVESHGVDSLVAVELRNWLANEVDADVAVFELLGSATLRSVGTVVAGKSFNRK
ncbi:MAG: hypothetical protein Q9193_000877 [Seirophora villosa]